MRCPHCDHTKDEIENPEWRKDHHQEIYLDGNNQAFYKLPLDLVQQDASRYETALYACPKCCKTFINP